MSDYYKVRWANAEGESGYADGSTHGKTFATYRDATAYAHEYARAVGDVQLVSSNEEEWFVTTKRTGYAERVWVEPQSDRVKVRGR